MFQLLFLYNILFFLVIIMGSFLLIPIVLITEKRRTTAFHRLGFLPLPEAVRRHKFLHPDKHPIWVHALSVGEVLSAVQLVRGLKRTWVDNDIIFSASTKTGFDIARERLRDDVIGVFYFPYDLLFSVKRILGQIDPSLVLLVETDIWPNFLQQMRNRNVPVILVNARLSERSFLGFRSLQFFISRVLGNLAAICVQSTIDARRYRLLGLPSDKIIVTGNFKFDQPYRTDGAGETEGLRRKMKLAPNDKILLAGSTHKGEETLLAEAFSKMKRGPGNYRFIVAPRDPKRADSVRRIFAANGLSVLLLKELAQDNYGKTCDVLVVDVMGVLKDLYALADCAFIGGSLVPCGGHNPLEPAAFSRPIIFGPDMSDFLEVSDLLIASGGAICVKDSRDFYQTAVMIMEDGIKASTMGENAFQVFNENKGAVAKTLKVVRTFLPDGLTEG